jgi:hypothetical protein
VGASRRQQRHDERSSDHLPSARPPSHPMNHDQFIASCAWAWARGSVDMLTSLRNHGLIGHRIAGAFAKTWADAIDEAMREVDLPETERIEVLHQFDDLIRS